MKALLIGGLAAAVALTASVSPLAPHTGIIEAVLPPASGALAPSPLNSNFSTGSRFVSAPSNYGFESGLANWSVWGDATKVSTPTSGGQSGGYLKITNGGMNDWVVSDAFTPTAAGRRLSYYLSGSEPTMNVAVPPYTSWAGLPSTGGSGWNRVTADLSSYVGVSRPRVSLDT